MLRRTRGFALVLALLTAIPLQAGLILNQTGIDLGFELTTIVSGYSAQYGPTSARNRVERSGHYWQSPQHNHLCFQ
jgi:hypothetical protein